MEEKSFKIEITEILQKVIEVQAQNQDEAYKLVREKYKNEEIVLTDYDCVDTNIKEIL